MATVISEEHAYAHLRDVVDRAMRGEEIDIEQGGIVKVRLVPVASGPVLPRQAGTIEPASDGSHPFRRQFGEYGPLSDEEAEESIRSLPREYWGDIGEDD